MGSACIYMECAITHLILGVSRKDDPNAWGLPGGKVETFPCATCVGVDRERNYCVDCKNTGNRVEPEIVAATRELCEETGVDLYRGLWHWYPEIFRREGGVTFRAEVNNIYQVHKPKAGETGRVSWVTPDQLMAGPFGDYNRRLLKAIGRIA